MGIKSNFRKYQRKHPNFMTPNIEILYSKRNKIAEISSGRSIFKENKQIFGSTIMKETSPNIFKNLGGKMFYNINSAKKYAKKRLKAKR